jgi:hypothetical protein
MITVTLALIAIAFKLAMALLLLLLTAMTVGAPLALCILGIYCLWYKVSPRQVYRRIQLYLQIVLIKLHLM